MRRNSFGKYIGNVEFNYEKDEMRCFIEKLKPMRSIDLVICDIQDESKLLFDDFFFPPNIFYFDKFPIKTFSYIIDHGQNFKDIHDFPQYCERNSECLEKIGKIINSSHKASKKALETIRVIYSSCIPEKIPSKTTIKSLKKKLRSFLNYVSNKLIKKIIQIEKNFLDNMQLEEIELIANISQTSLKFLKVQKEVLRKINFMMLKSIRLFINPDFTKEAFRLNMNEFLNILLEKLTQIKGTLTSFSFGLKYTKWDLSELLINLLMKIIRELKSLKNFNLILPAIPIKINFFLILNNDFPNALKNILPSLEVFQMAIIGDHRYWSINEITLFSKVIKNIFQTILYSISNKMLSFSICFYGLNFTKPLKELYEILKFSKNLIFVDVSWSSSQINPKEEAKTKEIQHNILKIIQNNSLKNYMGLLFINKPKTS